MKKIIAIATLLLFAALRPTELIGQEYKVVFDLTSGNTDTHARVMRWVKSITNTHPDARISIVFYGKSLPMVEKATTKDESGIAELVKSGQVAFSVCEQAMKVHKVTNEMLLPGVGTVPDALFELVKKQADGYGYIKVVD